MLPLVQILGLGLSVLGASFLAIEALAKFRMSAEEEAIEEMKKSFGRWGTRDPDQIRRLARERYLPDVLRKRRYRGAGAILLASGFVLQSLGLVFGV